MNDEVANKGIVNTASSWPPNKINILQCIHSVNLWQLTNNQVRKNKKVKLVSKTESNQSITKIILMKFQQRQETMQVNIWSNSQYHNWCYNCLEWTFYRNLKSSVMMWNKSYRQHMREFCD